MNDLLAQVLRSSQHTFIGRLAADPELRYFESGTSLCDARLLVNPVDAKRDDGSKPDPFKLKVWGDSAQAFADGAKKGDLVAVTGRVKFETWTDREGNDRTDVVVKVEGWSPAGKPRASQPAAAPAPQARPATSAWAGAAPAAAPATQAAPAAPAWNAGPLSNDDLPS
jgi:single-strand DNA-binding protein